MVKCSFITFCHFPFQTLVSNRKHVWKERNKLLPFSSSLRDPGCIFFRLLADFRLFYVIFSPLTALDHYKNGLKKSHFSPSNPWSEYTLVTFSGCRRTKKRRGDRVPIRELKIMISLSLSVLCFYSDCNVFNQCTRPSLYLLKC